MIIRNFSLVISVVAISLSGWSASIETIVGSGREETKDGHSLRADTNNPFGVTRGLMERCGLANTEGTRLGESMGKVM